MSFNKPDAPDPTVTANTQQQYNLGAAQDQNKINSYNQATPFGSVSYVSDPSSPSGYRLVTNTSQTGNNLINQAQSLSAQTNYGQPPALGTQDIANQLNQWQQAYQQPIFDQQDSNLEAQLRNQGLTPGSQAYDNAKNLLARNQGDVTNQYLTQNEGQAFNQAVQQYQLPLQTVAGLLQTASPGSFQQTPTAQIQPANYAGLAEQNYQNQLNSYNTDWNNIAKLGTSAIGLAAAPFTGGTSLLASGLGMFGSTPDYGQASNQSIGGYSMPVFGRGGGV